MAHVLIAIRSGSLWDFRCECGGWNFYSEVLDSVVRQGREIMWQVRQGHREHVYREGLGMYLTTLSTLCRFTTNHSSPVLGRIDGRGLVFSDDAVTAG